MLLDFPPELIQLVLLNCTTPAFLQTAFTCRALYEIASGCREVLVHHLRRTPGSPLDVSSRNTRQLFPLLKKSAFRQLYGSQFDASCTTFEFGDRTPIVRASSLALSRDTTLVLTTCRDQKVVHVLEVRQGQLLPLAQLRLPWDNSGSVEILKTAFDGYNHVFILHRYTPDVEEHDSDAEHPFVKQARASGREGSIYLTYHSLHSPGDPVRVSAISEHADFEPSALAVANDGKFAISWCHRMFLTHMVMLYTIREESDYEAAPNLIEFNYSFRQIQHTHGLSITEMSFNDRSTQLLYYYQAGPLYGSFQKIDRTGPPSLYTNSSPVQFTDDLNLLFGIGIPFFGTHETLHLEGHGGHEVCRWRYLALGIATHREQNWTVACLLRSEAICQSRNCGHRLNLERGRRLDTWVVAARLWGFRNSTDSLGCKVATSRLGTRIAVANWNVVYVWALNPRAVIDLDPNGYYHASWKSSSTGLIELQPIVLKLDAVCFRLRFTEENELVAITDRGIMLWDLTPSKRGSRTRQELAL